MQQRFGAAWPLRGLKATRSLSPSVASGNDTMAKRRRVDQTKGIFCLEGNWFGTKDRTTIEPVLRLLEMANDLRVPYVHFDVATREELEFRLKEWGKASFRNYPILYLAFHGNPGEIQLGQANGGFKLKDLGYGTGRRLQWTYYPLRIMLDPGSPWQHIEQNVAPDKGTCALWLQERCRLAFVKRFRFAVSGRSPGDFLHCPWSQETG